FQVGFTSGNNLAAPIGTVILDGGTLRVPAGNPAYFVNRITSTSAGGTIDLTGSSAVLDLTGTGAGVTINSNSAWSGAGSFIDNFSGATADVTVSPNVMLTNHIPLLGAFRILGGGTLSIVTPVNGASPRYLVSQGRLRVDDLSTPGGFSVLGNIVFGSLTLDGGILQFSGPTEVSSMPIALSSAGGTIEVSNLEMLTLNGQIAGSGPVVGPLVKSGQGVLVLTNSANTYAGGIIVTGGRLDVGGDSELGAATPTVNPGGTLRYTASATTTRAFNLAGGTLESPSGVTLILNGAAVNGGFLAGPGTFTVMGGTTLNGATSSSSTNINQVGQGSYANFTNGGL